MYKVNPPKARTASLLSAIFLSVASVFAQAPQPDSDALRARVDAIVQKMTLEEKIDYIGGTASPFAPCLVSTCLPSKCPTARTASAATPASPPPPTPPASAWPPHGTAISPTRVGEGIGRDARARGIHYMLGPGVNIYRSPRNGRNFEYFGEDPFLAAAMTVGYITGMQSQGVSATVKHFMGNNSEFLRHDSDSIIDERTMREIYLPAFEAAVKKAHVGSIMDSYNITNGQHMTQNGYLNIDVARKEWGFNGVMMSDWVATYDGVAAANGGLDLEMPTGAFMNRKNLLPAIKTARSSRPPSTKRSRNILEYRRPFRLARSHPDRHLHLLLRRAESTPSHSNAARERRRASQERQTSCCR